MNEDDDDLPVLTQILRTGTAPPADDAGVHEHGPDDFVARPTADDPLMDDQLVIGNEPRHEIEGYLAPSFEVSNDAHDSHDAHDAHEARDASDVVDAPAMDQAIPRADSFVLPQDHDGPHDAQAGHDHHASRPMFDEPELAAVALDPPTDASSDTITDHSAPFAARVRDAVLEHLSARIDTELDARIAQAMHLEVETALARLQLNLRTQLAEAMKDVVGRAVDEEIARLAAIDRSDST